MVQSPISNADEEHLFLKPSLKNSFQVLDLDDTVGFKNYMWAKTQLINALKYLSIDLKLRANKLGARKNSRLKATFFSAKMRGAMDGLSMP